MKREEAFLRLCRRAQTCRRCRRLSERRAVLSRENGSLHARLMFIAEAPGRFGADRTGVPLHGDRTGDNFEALLETAGLSRSDCFITNAVLCNPRDGDDRNRRPRAVEIGNCTDFLRWQIELIQPAVVATLGAVALDALRRVEDHSLVLAGGVGKLHRWFDRLLFPLYHPSPLAGMHRSRDLQRRDFIELASQAARLKD